MKRIGFKFTLFIVFLPSLSVSASTAFFVPCKEAFKNTQFQALKQGLKDVTGEQCFRLNNREFLVTVKDTGRTGQGLFYFNSDSHVFESSCGKNCYQPGMNVEREFLGANGKRYVLLSTSDLQGGVGSKQYEILNLVPAKEGARPFVKYDLFSAESSTWGDAAERCREEASISEDTDVVNYVINNEGSAEVSVAFAIEGENCKTKTKIKNKKTFVLVDGIFKQT